MAHLTDVCSNGIGKARAPLVDAASHDGRVNVGPGGVGDRLTHFGAHKAQCAGLAGREEAHDALADAVRTVQG